MTSLLFAAALLAFGPAQCSEAAFFERPDAVRLIMVKADSRTPMTPADCGPGACPSRAHLVQGVRAGGWIDDGDVVRTTPTPERASCAFTFHRYGDYMLVEELSVCGGMGVGFRGVYRRDGSVQPGPVLKAPWDED